MYIIEIVNSSKPCWIASWEGDPPRTTVLNNAQIFKSIKNAQERIKECKEMHPFKPMVYKVQKAGNF